VVKVLPVVVAFRTQGSTIEGMGGISLNLDYQPVSDKNIQAALRKRIADGADRFFDLNARI
jgi:hypothetical protein